MARDAAQFPEPSNLSDEETLIAVYRDTVDELYAFIARRCGTSRELVEDVTQEVYLRATIAWRKGGVPDEPIAWLKAVARNLLIKLYRKKRPQLVDAKVVDEIVEQAEPPKSPEASALIHWGIDQLADRHARLIEAFHLEGRTTRQIAESDGLSERAVEGRLHRARRLLRKRLKPFCTHAGDTP